MLRHLRGIERVIEESSRQAAEREERFFSLISLHLATQNRILARQIGAEVEEFAEAAAEDLARGNDALIEIPIVDLTEDGSEEADEGDEVAEVLDGAGEGN